MNDEAKRLVNALREDAEWAHANEWETPITLGDNLTAAADMIEKLAADRDAWKRRAEAAERDLGRFEACTTCKHDVDDGTPCEVCMGIDTGELGLRWNYYEWRGPCAENGGTEDATTANIRAEEASR